MENKCSTWTPNESQIGLRVRLVWGVFEVMRLDSYLESRVPKCWVLGRKKRGK